jgi:hypothetical protein
MSHTINQTKYKLKEISVTDTELIPINKVKKSLANMIKEAKEKHVILNPLQLSKIISKIRIRSFFDFNRNRSEIEIEKLMKETIDFMYSYESRYKTRRDSKKIVIKYISTYSAKSEFQFVIESDQFDKIITNVSINDLQRETCITSKSFKIETMIDRQKILLHERLNLTHTGITDKIEVIKEFKRGISHLKMLISRISEILESQKS